MNTVKDTYILYVGTYTEMIDENFGEHGAGINCFEFNASTGELKLLNQTFQINPSYLTVFNLNNTSETNAAEPCLVAVAEVVASKKPALYFYSIHQDHSLHASYTASINGGCPCQLTFFKSNEGDAFIAIACYETGNIIVYDVHAKMEPISIQHSGHSQHPARQTAAHAHCVCFDAATNKLLVADLGLDQVVVYSIQNNKGKIEATEIQIMHTPAGSGPRHICFDRNQHFGFILNELNGTICLIIHEQDQYLIKDIFPNNAPNSTNVDRGAAAIRASANGKFVYTSIRSNNTISLYALDPIKASLDFIEAYPTGGDTPRDFTLDPTGNWLLVGHQYSDTISIFNVNSYNGKLSLFKIVENINSPVSFSWA